VLPSILKAQVRRFNNYYFT